MVTSSRSVKLATRDDKTFAVKIIDVPLDDSDEDEMDPDAELRRSSIGNEIQALIACKNHPNIIELYDTIEDRGKHKLWLVLEYAGGSDLFEMIGACKPRKKRRQKLPLA